MQERKLRDTERITTAASEEGKASSTLVSRRGLLLGLAATSAFVLPAISTPANAAVSMLRTGVDPDLAEGEDEIVEVRGRRRRRRRRGRGRRRGRRLYGRRRGRGRRRRRRRLRRRLNRLGVWIYI